MVPGTGLLTADIAIALGFLAAGIANWLGAGSVRVGLLAILAGGAWLGSSLTLQPTGPEVARLVRVGNEVIVLVLIVHLVVEAASRGRTTRTGRNLVAILYGAALVLATLRIATYDPFLELDCPGSCAHVPSIIDLGPASQTLLREGLAGLVIFAGGALTLFTARLLIDHARSASSRSTILAGGFIVGSATAALGTVALVQAAPLGAPFGTSRGETLETLRLTLDVGAFVLVIGLIWSAIRALRLRVRLRRLADDLEAAPAPGTFQMSLANALDDPSVEVGYWSSDRERYVGADGGPFAIEADAAGTVTAIERGGRPVAVVHHRADIDSTALVGEIGPSMLVALDNERLRAVSLAQLAELRASRARIVELGDSERLRIERNLHDGAQQRLLAISFELRLARLTAERVGEAGQAQRLATVEEMAAEAVEDLRRFARGIHPAVLSQAGLSPALASLTEEAPIAVEVVGDIANRLAPSVESSAYQVVVEVLADAVRRGAHALTVHVGMDSAMLIVETWDDGDPSPALPIRLADRVSAAGGDLEMQAGPLGSGTSFRAALPCG